MANVTDFDPAHVAEGAMDRCCAGDPLPTACNLARFQRALLALAVARLVRRVRTQPRRTLKWGAW